MKTSIQRMVFVVGLMMLMLTLSLFVSAQHLIRVPYLTRATQHSITISWNTDIACNSKINVGLQPGNYTGGIVNNSPTTNELEIRGLPEGLNTLYWYNSLGQLIKTTSSNSREPVLHVDLSSFQTGTYFLSILQQTDILGRFSIQVGAH